MEATAETLSITVAVAPEAKGMTELLKVTEGLFVTDGKIVSDRVTVPEKVFRLVRVIVEELVNPKGTANEFGLATMLMSGMVTVMPAVTG